MSFTAPTAPGATQNHDPATRALNPRMAEILAKSPELTAYEEKLFASLNHGSKNGRIRLTITSHDAQSLQMHDESGNLSECSRPQ